jgi:heavy metal sensor kinase
MEAAETVYGKFEVPIRVLSVAVETSQGDDVVLQLGVSMRRTIITSEGFLRNLAIAIAVLFFVSLLAGWAMATKSLRPVHDIIETTRAITAERLQERLHPVGSEDEIDQLIHTLNNMIERLEAAFKQISQFTADASHELRTPLAVMRGEIEVALEYSKTVAELRSVLASMLEEIDRLSGIASDLLLLARADARLGAEHFENVNIQQLLMDVVSDAKVLAASRGIELRSGPIQEGVLLGNRDWLRRIFMNLLDNAVKFTPSGGEVKLSCEIRDGKAMVVVEDNGIGIDPKDLPQVFNRFYKRSPVGTPASDKGVGLGLSICKALAEQHGGTISVQSVLHRGTTFTILLPLLSASTSSASSI